MGPPPPKIPKNSFFIKTFQFSIRMTTFDLLIKRSSYIAFLVTDEYLRTKEHNDSTLLYLIDGKKLETLSAIPELNPILQNITFIQPCTTQNRILPIPRYPH